MKLARYVHHLNNFHLLKTEGVNQRAAEGASKNPQKIETREWGSLRTWNFQG